MECDICLIEWDSVEHIPRLLPCGHTFCERCLSDILNKKTKFLCPICNTQTEINSLDDIKKLVKNFNLLQICEKISEKKNNLAQCPINQSIILDQSEEETDESQLCPSHGLIIHSYAVGTNLVMCDKCIENTKFNVVPLPNAIKEMRRKIDTCQLKACLYKNEIEKIETFFIKYLEEFEKTNKNKIEKLFAFFYSMIKFYHNDALQLLNQCIAEQKSQVEIHLGQTKKLKEELTQVEKDLLDINSLSDNAIISSIQKINKISHRLSSFINYNLQFDLLSMNIGMNEMSKKKIFNSIRETYQLEVEFLEIEKKSPSIKKILSLGESWECVCGEMDNSISDVKCSACGLYRRIETFKNLSLCLFDNTVPIPTDEIKLLNQRRKEEANEFQNCIKQTDCEKYYAVAINWYLSWKCYITNDSSEKYIKNSQLVISSNKLVGVLMPGPINNMPLVNKDSKGKFKIKQNLQKNKDYVIVNELVWDFFSYNYNGGPAIILNSNNEIYSSITAITQASYASYTQIKDQFEEDTSKLED